MVTRIEPLMTIADLDAMPDDEYRYEVIEGELFVSRSPTLTHQSVSGNLFMGIKTFLLENPLGEIWATPGVILSEFSGVIPEDEITSSVLPGYICRVETIFAI